MENSEINLNNNIEAEKFLSNYIIAFDKCLVQIDPKISDSDKKEILKAAWDVISKNSIWYLGNYRLNLDKTQEKIVPVPIYELAFCSRIIIETAGDFEFYFFANKKDIDKFFKEYTELNSESDEDLIKKICEIDYNRGYMPSKKTIARLKDCFGEAGVGYYNILCRNNHFNYLGYRYSVNNIFTYGARTHGLIFILAALETLYESLVRAGLLESENPLKTYADQSDRYAKLIKGQQ